MAHNVRRIERNEDEEMDSLAGFILGQSRYPWDVIDMNDVGFDRNALKVVTWLTARRAIWLFAILAAVIVAVLALRLMQAHAAKNALANKSVVPTVSVALSWGGDSDFRSPMAIAVIGGLTTSTLLTLVIVPAVFTVCDDIERWMAPRAGKLLAEPHGRAAGRPSTGRADSVA